MGKGEAHEAVPAKYNLPILPFSLRFVSCNDALSNQTNVMAQNPSFQSIDVMDHFCAILRRKRSARIKF